MLELFNSLNATLQPVTKSEDGKTRIYVCGVTVYDLCHIGHARSMVVFDAYVRYLRSLGREVEYVCNITDVDDKIIARAESNNESTEDLTARMIDKMHADLDALGLNRPDHEPRATQYIAEMIAMIEDLIAKDYAYAAGNGDICFAVRNFKDYGKLSHRKLDDLISGARVAVDAGKRDPADFVLWKLAKAGEPAWDSPWGAGRPGWHMECSAMSEALLHSSVDIHGGGMDLKFPHHENEIAQSEAFCGHEHVKLWMHIGLVNIDNEKMSKSLNNFVTIEQALQDNSAEVLRYLLLSSHYRSPVNYSNSQLQAAKQSLSRLYGALDGLDLSVAALDDNGSIDAFNAALAKDFNIPEALAVCFDMARTINKLKDAGEYGKASAQAVLMQQLLQPLNLLQGNIKTFLSKGGINEEEIKELIDKRTIARKNKDWSQSDQIRDKLLAMGVELLDNPQGTDWRYTGDN
jgi:cysteinyl-tRNA synthetase